MPIPTTSLDEGDVKRLREQLVPIVSDGGRTDVQVSPILWVILPFIGLMVAMVVVMAMLFAQVFTYIDADEYDPAGPYSPDFQVYLVVFYAISVIFYAVMALLAYRLVKRHNGHFARERRLRDVIMSFSQRSTGAGFQYSIPANAETTRSPILWAMVIALPGIMTLISVVAMSEITSVTDSDIGLYVLIALVQGVISVGCLIAEFYLLYFLTVEMANHHKRWMGFVRETKVLFGRAGYTAGGISEPNSLPDRSIALYVIASVFTGVFVIYWLYSIVKDGNEHFRHHRHFEDQLVAFLSTRPHRVEDQDASISWV
ncbi:MAG: hypothetical protein WBD03_04525 [Thermoplasmata archaeon]